MPGDVRLLAARAVVDADSNVENYRDDRHRALSVPGKLFTTRIRRR